MTILVFAVLAVCYVARTLADLYLTQTFVMRWRIWLSRRFIDDWLGDYAYFRNQFSRRPIDNPDQRIQQDIDIFTGRLSAVMDNYANWRNRMVLFTGWNLSASQAIDPLPFIVQAPRLFLGHISLGDIFQPAAAFHTIHNSLSFFRDAYDSFASYRAAVIRLDGLVDENALGRRFPQLASNPSSDNAVTVDVWRSARRQAIL
jgi:ABC-type uncharacterized transport system fused permease/ATPase subunit